MSDRIHQPYRAAICPLLPRLLPLGRAQWNSWQPRSAARVPRCWWWRKGREASSGRLAPIRAAVHGISAPELIVCGFAAYWRVPQGHSNLAMKPATFEELPRVCVGFDNEWSSRVGRTRTFTAERINHGITAILSMTWSVNISNLGRGETPMHLVPNGGIRNLVSDHSLDYLRLLAIQSDKTYSRSVGSSGGGLL